MAFQSYAPFEALRPAPASGPSPIEVRIDELGLIRFRHLSRLIKLYSEAIYHGEEAANMIVKLMS